jgi:hypothetical protein
MITSLLLHIIFIFSMGSVLAEGERRFPKESLGFSLHNHSGGVTPCSHELLSHVPWWRVTCGQRQYTVDIWRQESFNHSQNQTRITIMYDVSEGVESSGEKGVQFHGHFTSMDVTDLSSLARLSSFIDVRNGQASLRVEVEL